MGIETNLNQSPYFDDFNENKNFHRVLFRPGYAVQARELTQLQSILQNQIERFANRVVNDGKVVSGVGLKTERIDYVKLRDLDNDGGVVLLGDFFESGAVANAIVTGATTGMTAQLIDAKEGSEAASPNFLSIFVKYTNSGANNTTKAFANNEVITVRRRSDNVLLATALTANSSSGGAVGEGIRATVSDGIIYHKGHFARVAPQSTIVEKYSTTPTKRIGFETRETIIDSNSDSSLLDNATGATNYAAPGANRLKLTPTLAVRDVTSANTTTFFEIARLEEGKIIQRVNTDLGGVNRMIADRIFETNGNFAVEPFNIRIREHQKRSNNLGRYEDGDIWKLVAQVEPAIGYVGGNRIELSNTAIRNVEKANTVATTTDAVFTQAMGQYVIVDEVCGTWDLKNLDSVSLRSVAEDAVTGGAYSAHSVDGGTEIGTANVRGIEYHSGTPGSATAKFRLYLFNIVMDTGYSFSEVRSIYAVDSGGSGVHSFADPVLEGGIAVLKEKGLNTLLYPFTQKGTRIYQTSDTGLDALSGTQFVYRREVGFTKDVNQTQTLTIAGSGLTGGTEKLNETGAIGDTLETEFVFVSTQAVDTANKTGTISVSGTTVTGSSAALNTEYSVGDFIKYDGNIGQIATITDADNATLESATGDASSVTHARHYKAGHIFDFGGTFRNLQSSSDTQILVDFGEAFASTFTGKVYANVLRTSAVPASKDVNKDKFIHINTSTHSAGAQGPWSLGVCDAFKLVAVYKGTPTGVGTTDTNVTEHFELVSGQKDGFYGTSYLRKKSTSTLDVSASGLMVKFHYFTRNIDSGVGFFCADSYPINDHNPGAADAILTQEIPLFVSPTSGKRFDLRDCLDFRQYMTNAVTPSGTGTVASAPTNPAVLSAFSIPTESFIVAPDENTQTTIDYYLPRRDRVILTKEGAIEVVKGIPSLSPRTPDARGNSMTLGTINIPVYPSLSPYTAKTYSRPEYAVSLSLENNRRYTMKDLRAVEERVKNLEYYSSLNALEASAKNKQIFGSTGLDRFKNGFLVDNFDGHNIADSTKIGYRAAIDRNRAELRPTFDRRDVKLGKDVSLTSTGVTQTGNLLTLSYTNTNFAEQVYASKLRNPVQELTFNWVGEIELNPPMDNTPDVTTLPDIQVDFDGMYTAIETIAELTGITGIDWGNWQTTSVSRTTERNGDLRTRTTQTEQIQQGIQTSISPSTESFSIGNFVENVAVRDFMRSKLIEFTGYRMKPNTRVYPYFDGELVTGYCTPTNSSFANTDVQGANLVTDSTGTIYGVFRIPNDDNLKFRIGTKRFELKDVANTITQSNLVTTSAFGDYTSIPLDITQRGSSVNMIVPQITQENTTRNRTLTEVRVQDMSDDDNDPLSQTFFVGDRGQNEGVFITQLDLWFGRKSTAYPITVQIRETENGYPTNTVVPFGSKTLQPASVNADSTSATSSALTEFVFNSPVFLQSGKEYCFTVIPGGNSDEYALWVGELGGTDVDTNELIHKQPASGVMFTSANDRTWSAIQSEDVKFRFKRASFGSSGTVYIENEDLNYFTFDNRTGTFQNDEKIIAESVLTFANNDSVSVGQVVRSYAAEQGVANNHFANGVIREIVTSGSGSVTIKIDNYGRFPTTGSSANALNVFLGDGTWIGNTSAFSANNNQGFVKFVNNTTGKMDLQVSSQEATKVFANGWVRGQVSGATARITSVDNIVMNTLVPKIPQITYADTSADWEIRTTSTGGTISSSYAAVSLGEENSFRDGEKKVYSKTNESGLASVGGSQKSLVLKGSLSTTSNFVSPAIDVSRSNGIVIENIINNDSGEEWKEVGNASVRYITRPVELADGNEAEDLKVYVNAHKPSGTDVKVYARVHNPEDSEGIDDKDFTPLTQVTSANTYSDSVDIEDINEYEFGFVANTDGSGFGSSSNNHAYLNSANNDVLVYRSSDGSINHTYKTFAIKIVLTSSNTAVVPLVRDMRAIALQK